MVRTKEINWLAPASMMGALLAGVLFAVGHHLFYQVLAGKTARTATRFSFLGLDISRQEASIAIGTALAFLTKGCLVYAVVAAYIQAFWKEASESMPRRHLRLWMQNLREPTSYLCFPTCCYGRNTHCSCLPPYSSLCKSRPSPNMSEEDNAA